MAKDPAFLLYHQDFYTGVSDMTNEEIGAYILCLCVQASKGGITEKHMLIICKTQEVHNVVKNKFMFNNETNLFENIRLKNEIEKRKKYSESRSNNRKGKTKPIKNKPILSKSYVKHMENENEKENIYKSFNHLYITVSDFEKLKTEFSEIDILDCFERIENYKENTKYKSLYLTSKQWLKKQKKDNSLKSNQNEQITGKQQFKFSTDKAIKTIIGNNE